MVKSKGAAGFLVALTFILGSAAINGVTAWHLGNEDWQRWVFAGIVIGAVICEALGFLFVKHHWQMGNRLLALAGVGLMIAAAAYTVRMELRFFTESHSGMSGNLDAKAQDRRDYDADIARARQELSWIPQHRAATVVRTQLASLKARRKGSTEKYCSMKTRWAGKICREMTALASELATAEQADRLKTDIGRWTSEKRKAPVIADAMPEAAWLSRRLPVSQDSATDWLMIGGILFLLLGRTFALPLAMTGAPSSLKGTQLASRPKPPEYNALGEDSTYVPADGGEPLEDSTSVPASGNVLIFPKHVGKNTLDQFIYLLRDAGGGSMSFPEIWAEYQRFCATQGVAMEARNYVGKRLRDMGFHNERPKPRSGARVTVYEIPPLLQEAA